jgi:hypothetical protein
MRWIKRPNLIELLAVVWLIAVMVLFLLQFLTEAETGLGVLRRALGLE